MRRGRRAVERQDYGMAFTLKEEGILLNVEMFKEVDEGEKS